MVTLPDGVEVGDVLKMVAVTEDTRAKFANPIEVTVRPWAEHRKGGDTKRRDKNSERAARQGPRTSAPAKHPKIDPVYRDRWEKFKFDEYTAMKMDVEYDDAENEIPSLSHQHGQHAAAKRDQAATL